MRFQAYFTPIIKIILYIMAAISVIGLIIGILVFAKVPIELTTGQATLLVSLCPVCAVISLLFATLHYTVTNTHLRLNVGLIDVLGGRVCINKIVNIVIDGKLMYISYIYKGMDPIIAAIAINPKRYDEMKDLLMAKNPNIQFFENKNESDNSKQ